MSKTLIGVIVAVVLIFFYGVSQQRSMVTLSEDVEQKMGDLQSQYQRRSDLIPNLVSTVKGYAKHESGVFEEVTKARSAIMDAKGVKVTAQAENMLQDALKSLFAVSEAYPDLKANQNFADLQNELVDTEDKIQAARRFYNGGVRDFNTKIKLFPNNIFAGMLGFSERDFFEVEDRASVEKPVDVQF